MDSYASASGAACRQLLPYRRPPFRPMPHASTLATFLFVTAALLPAQGKVALPHDTGNLTPAADWVVLQGDTLAATSRLTDPTDEPAHSILLAITQHLQQEKRTAEHVLLHQPGSAPGQLRTINAYSAPVTATTAALQSDRAIDQMHRALEDALAGPGTKVVYHGGEKWEAFAVGGAVLSFELVVGDRTLVDKIHVVPAGEHLQYFEVQYDARDEAAPLAIAAVLATFDGAREKDSGLPWPMILGGIGGGIAGALAGRLRNKRRAAAAAAAAQSGGDGG